MDPGGSERHQIWLLNTMALEARKLTKDDEKIYNFGCFSPKGDAICYASNERDEKFFDIYTMSLTDRQPRLVYKSDATNWAVDWMSDQNLVIGRSNTNLDNDLFLLSLDDSGAVNLTSHRNEAYFEYAGHSIDSRTLYVISNKNREFAQPSSIDLTSRKLTVLAEDEWDAVGGKVSPDGRLFGYFRNVNGTSQLHVYDLERKSDTRASGLPLGTLEAPLISGYDMVGWDPKSKRFIFSFQGPKYNLNLWLYDQEHESVKQITFVPKGGIPQDSLTEPTFEAYSTFDGLKIPVLEFRPSDGQGPKATVVYVHGGPESQEKARFNIIIQYLANRGFLVLAPNVRGSSGYGKKWIHLDDVEKRLDSVRDLEYLVKWAVGTGRSEAGKIGIVGGSYGGFMVLSAITEFPELWGAAVDVFGIANFTTFLEKTAKWRRHLRTAEYGDPEKNAELFKRISPIHNIERVKASLLVIHGANDPRVPVQEAEQIVGRLKELGRRVEYLRFEDEGHGIAKISNRVKAYTAIGDFLEKTLKKP